MILAENAPLEICENAPATVEFEVKVDIKRFFIATADYCMAGVIIEMSVQRARRMIHLNPLSR